MEKRETVHEGQRWLAFDGEVWTIERVLEPHTSPIRQPEGDRHVYDKYGPRARWLARDSNGDVYVFDHNGVMMRADRGDAPPEHSFLRPFRPGVDDHLLRKPARSPATAPETVALLLGFSHDRWEKLLDETFAEIRKLGTLKGGEYSGDVDRLANFRRNGADLDLPKETIWRVYAAKHWDAIGQYIRDLQKGTERTRLEGIDGRVDDLLVYLLLFKAMLKERADGAGN